MAASGVATHQNRLDHALITDPDLALIVGAWDRLDGQCKARLIKIVRANMPT